MCVHLDSGLQRRIFYSTFLLCANCVAVSQAKHKYLKCVCTTLQGLFIVGLLEKKNSEINVG